MICPCRLWGAQRPIEPNPEVERSLFDGFESYGPLYLHPLEYLAHKTLAHPACGNLKSVETTGLAHYQKLQLAMFGKARAL